MRTYLNARTIFKDFVYPLRAVCIRAGSNKQGGSHLRLDIIQRCWHVHLGILGFALSIDSSKYLTEKQIIIT